MSSLKSAVVKYTVVGVLFGCLFPLISWVIIKYVSTNIYVLFGLICSAPLFLGLIAAIAGKKEDIIDKANANLHLEVEERTAEIKSLMDLSGQGFLSFGEDFTINREYSKECEAIFDTTDIAGKYIYDFLFINPDIIEEFKEGLGLIFTGNTDPEVVFDLIDKDAIIKGKSFKLDYKMLDKDNILCVIIDVSNELELEERIRRENDRRNMIYHAISHKNSFSNYINLAFEIFDFIEVISSTGNKVEDLETLKRNLHTMKGDCGFFGFQNTQEVVQDFEYYVADSITLGEAVELKDIAIDLKRNFYDELHIITDILGEKWLEDAGSIHIPAKNYLKIENYIKKKYGEDAKLIKTIEKFRMEPIVFLFSRFPAMCSRLGEKLGKRLKPLKITGGEFEVLPDRFTPLITSLNHIIRNMVDHGIEPPLEREIQHKPVEGEITINIMQTPKSIVIKMSDDGKGISVESLRRRAIEKNIINENDSLTDKEIIGLLFNQDFSTKDEVTEVSGMGIGLAAVKNEVDQLKGMVNTYTKINQGTTFEIIIPV